MWWSGVTNRRSRPTSRATAGLQTAAAAQHRARRPLAAATLRQEFHAHRDDDPQTRAASLLLAEPGRHQAISGAGNFARSRLQPALPGPAYFAAAVSSFTLEKIAVSTVVATCEHTPKPTYTGSFKRSEE